ncbi:DUF350 domain-containing protein [Arsenicicoccus sp. oral taxon 190]|uniref:DUF350 domain-containing protein n=1 Tax=Arsenicicoccus sp. oral taxon 190 TaxID=1658671 RepID=UPI00067A30A2|nr:DUF350 domain-containing protein [Arsenicicoccus sp. oral taxon 190]AKT52332.1 membrane protein [Arsenicicoccus sp. oral taxon 190]
MLESMLFAAIYCLVGIALLTMGFVVIDLLTPGRLGQRIYAERSMSAAVVVAAEFLGLGAIAFTTIWTNGAGGFGAALGWTVAFGVLGIALQALSFVVLDAITPGSLRAMAVERELHPGAVTAAAAMVAVSAIVCASIA